MATVRFVRNSLSKIKFFFKKRTKPISFETVRNSFEFAHFLQYVLIILCANYIMKKQQQINFFINMLGENTEKTQNY